MNEPKHYTLTDQTADMAAEPAAVAVRTLQDIDVHSLQQEQTENLVKSMPQELLQQASEYALKESRAGRGIPHAQAMDLIRERRGWK